MSFWTLFDALKSATSSLWATSDREIEDSPALCETCQYMLRQIERPRRSDREWSEYGSPFSTHQHHQAKEDLIVAAQRGCRICLVMLERVRKIPSSSQAEESCTTWTWNGGAYISLWPERSTRYGDSQVYWSIERPPTYRGYDRIKTAASTSEERVLQLARYWLQTCRASHKLCSARATGNWYPKRLIDVRQGTARLVITQEEELTEPYATLSHCWGKNQPFLVLTASNIRQLSKGIPNDSLPKTFADAIDVTRWLGIGYLWIDSLCIIQSGEGSKDDWLKHATEMASVYQNCVLNISADAGDNPHHGLYSTRNPDLVNELRAQVGRKYAYIWVDGLCGYDVLASTPLAKRGWVLQERLLAPRVLHMVVLQIFWECRETDLVCECHPEERPINAWGLGPISPFDITDIYHPVRVGDPPKDPWVRQNFRRVVEHYTRCDLTFPDTDKLVALAAIAQQATALLKDEYVAGMFRSDLASQLLWQASREAGRARDHYRAPSWSWASIDGPVKLFSPRIESQVKHFAEVQSHQVKLFDAHNPFGGIEAGSKLTILDFLLPLSGVTKGFFTTRGLGFGVTKPPGIAGMVISEGTIKLDDFTPEFLNFEDTDFYLFPVVQDCFDFHCLVLARSAREQGYLRVAHWMSDSFMGRSKRNG